MINQKGEEITTFIYDDITILDEEYAVVRKGNQCILFANEKEILSGDFEAITKPVDSYVFVKQDGKWGIVELKN